MTTPDTIRAAECETHHEACACREAEFRTLRRQVDIARQWLDFIAHADISIDDTGDGYKVATAAARMLRTYAHNALVLMDWTSDKKKAAKGGEGEG